MLPGSDNIIENFFESIRASAWSFQFLLLLLDAVNKLLSFDSVIVVLLHLVLDALFEGE